MSAPRIVVVGSTMVDQIAYVDRVPRAGETVTGNGFVLGFGGKGANQAVMAARLGASVAMVNCVGDDVFASMTIDNLAAEGVDVTQVGRVSGVASGAAPIWVEPDGANRIVVIPGANARMTPAQAERAIRACGRVDMVIGQLEIPPAVTAAGFAAARKAGARCVLNPAPMGDLPPELLAAADWVVPNEIEFAELARGCGAAGSREAVDPRRPGDLTRVAAALAARLAVTLGADGVALSGGARIAAPRVAAVDTTGAGDAFVGAFAYGLAAGLPPVDAARLGCRCAGVAVTRRGTRASFPDRGEIAAIRRDLGITDPA